MFIKDSKKLYVCEHCLLAIESREGDQHARHFYTDIDELEFLDDEDENERNEIIKNARCEWCDETSNELYEI